MSVDLSMDDAPDLVEPEEVVSVDLSMDDAPALVEPEEGKQVSSTVTITPEAASPDQAEPVSSSIDEKPDPAHARLIEVSNSAIKQELVLTSYRMQTFTKQNSLVRKIRSRGYWALSFFPTPLPVNKPEPSALGALIQQATVKRDGENYPLYYSGEEPECQADRVQQDYEVGATKCSWRQYSDGMYICFVSFPQDWIANPEIWDFGDDDETEPDRIFYPSEALRELSRFFEFISRQSATALGSEGSLYYVRASCIGLHGRPLVEDLPMLQYTQANQAEEKIFDWNRRLPIAALNEPKVLTLRILKGLLSVFDYSPDHDLLSEAYDHITNKSKQVRGPSPNKGG